MSLYPLAGFLGLVLVFGLGIYLGRRQALHRRDYDKDQIIALILGGMTRDQIEQFGGCSMMGITPRWVTKVADEIVEVHK